MRLGLPAPSQRLRLQRNRRVEAKLQSHTGFIKKRKKKSTPKCAGALSGRTPQQPLRPLGCGGGEAAEERGGLNVWNVVRTGDGDHQVFCLSTSGRPRSASPFQPPSPRCHSQTPRQRTFGVCTSKGPWIMFTHSLSGGGVLWRGGAVEPLVAA